MEILITNDDGYLAKGIREIAELMKEFGNVTIVAPEKGHSGMSAAFSLGKTLTLEKVSEKDGFREFYCTGTPADCIKTALGTLFLENKPDLLISGINHGLNSAVASVYSGTLGAALEAAINGIHAIGLSLDDHSPDADFSAVIYYTRKIVKQYLENPIPENIFLNINFPACGKNEIKGILAGHQGSGRWINELVISKNDGSGNMTYSFAGTFHDTEDEYGQGTDGAEMADHRILGRNCISIVPMTVDRTSYKTLEYINSTWDIIEK